MLEYIVLVVSALPSVCGRVSHNLSLPCSRHIHYLTLARFPLIQYCCRLLLLAIKVINWRLIFESVFYIYSISFTVGKFFSTRRCGRLGYRARIGINANWLASRSQHVIYNYRENYQPWIFFLSIISSLYHMRWHFRRIDISVDRTRRWCILRYRLRIGCLTK